MGKQIYPFEKHFVINWPYTDRTNDRPSALQGNQCLLSHFLGTVWEPRRKSSVSLIIPQYESSKITVFVCGKKYDPKIWKCSRRRRRANMTDLELQLNKLTVIWNHPWSIITSPVTKEHISQVSWVKSRIAPFLQNNKQSVYEGRESRFQ